MMNSVAKFKDAGKLMIKFKSRIVDKELEEAIDLENYIKELYQKSQRINLEVQSLHNEMVKEDGKENADTAITEEILEEARQKLCKDKARGVDEMADEIIRDEEIW